MAGAEANQASVRWALESTWGETAAGVPATEARITSETLQHQKATVKSQEVRSDRMTVAILEVGQSADGPVAFEVSYGDHEEFFKNALRNAIVSATFTGSTTAAASSITASAGVNFVASLAADQWIRIDAGGNANDQAVAQIASLTSTVLTVTGTTLTAGSMASSNIDGRTLTNGTTKSSFFIETNFTDITGVKYFEGMRVDSVDLQVQSAQIATGTFNFMGERGFTASTTVVSTLTSAGTTTPMTSAANVGTIRENGVALTNAVQSFSMTLSNNMFARPQVGSKTTSAHGDGSVSIEGQLAVYFEDISLYTKMIDHTTTDISMRFTDDASNVIVLTLPALKLTGGNPGVPGLDQDAFLQMNFEAFKDAATGKMIRMDFLPAD